MAIMVMAMTGGAVTGTEVTAEVVAVVVTGEAAVAAVVIAGRAAVTGEVVAVAGAGKQYDMKELTRK
jgi:hypothetical protein